MLICFFREIDIDLVKPFDKCNYGLRMTEGGVVRQIKSGPSEDDERGMSANLLMKDTAGGTRRKSGR